MGNEIKWINGDTIAKINFKIENNPISLDPEHISKAEALAYRVKNQYFYVGGQRYFYFISYLFKFCYRWTYFSQWA